jgi:hypothetical protein
MGRPCVWASHINPTDILYQSSTTGATLSSSGYFAVFSPPSWFSAAGSTTVASAAVRTIQSEPQSLTRADLKPRLLRQRLIWTGALSNYAIAGAYFTSISILAYFFQIMRLRLPTLSESNILCTEAVAPSVPACNSFPSSPASSRAWFSAASLFPRSATSTLCSV